MLILRIRQAETAMADGRLDEAFELARSDKVRAHRRGQDLIGRLVRSFVERGRGHLDAGRFQQAMADCEKAERLGGNVPDAAALRADIAEAIASGQRSERRRSDAIAAAREHIENGRLSMGQDLLADVSGHGDRTDKLHHEIVARRAAATGAIRRAEAAMEREDWAAAIDATSEARQAHASNEALAQLTGRLTESVNRRIRSAVVQGRLDLAELLLARLLPVAGQVIETQELSRIVAQCRLAGESVNRGQTEQACDVLRRLASILPDCEWARAALVAAQRADEGLNTLKGGPLGLLTLAAPNLNRTVRLDPPSCGPVATARPIVTGTPLPERFVIQVDGVGSFLVLRDRVVTIGPATSSRHHELGLMMDPGTPPATIERVDEDYFLSSSGPVQVNDRQTTRTLLNSGDRIVLSPRVRLRFTLPHAASTSAVLDLAGTRLPTGDARRVILLDRDIVIGPGPSSHIVADRLAEPVVLSLRDGRLGYAGREQVTLDDRPMDRHAGIPAGKPVRVGPVSFVITAA